MKFVYEVGMPIISLEHKTDRGVVTRVDEDGAWFRWDDDEPDEEHWCDDWNIMPDTQEAHDQHDELTRQVQLKIDVATSLLEQAFAAWQEAVSLQAGYEAGTSEAYHLHSNPDLKLSKFEGVVRANGWETSSLYC